jgi:hypothetical protein
VLTKAPQLFAPPSAICALRGRTAGTPLRVRRSCNLSVTSQSFAVSALGATPTVAGMTEATDKSPSRPMAAQHQRVPHHPNGNGVTHAPPKDHEDNPYLGDFSRRVAARLEHLPERTAERSLEDDGELYISWKPQGRSYKLLLTFMAGAILYGATVYPLLSKLRSSGVSAEATETTPSPSR